MREKSGKSSGRWVAARNHRDRFFLATKVRGRMWEGPDGEGLSRAHILRAVEDSHRRLQTDTIDLYQTHRSDANTPEEETLEVLDELVRQGKVRHIGCSNDSAGELRFCLGISRDRGWTRHESLPPYDNLAGRAGSRRCDPLFAVGRGVLTGKYRRGEEPPLSDRMTDIRTRYDNDRGFAIVEKAGKSATDRGVSTTAVSLAWLLSRRGVTASIIGANSIEQLRQSLEAGNLELTEDEVAALDRVSGPG